MKFVRTGFRIVRQNPALILAEIAWRWAFGAAAWLLVIFTIRTIMQGIDVSAAEIAVARSNNAYLIADAIARVLIQVLPRFLAAMVIGVPLLAVAWVIAATLGRAVTLDALLSKTQVDGIAPQRKTYIFRLGLLNCVRAVFSLATLLAFFGTVFLVSAQMNPSATPAAAPLYVLAWLSLAFLVGCFWGLVNWFLALAAILIARDGLGVRKALAGSVALYRDRPSDYRAIASWFSFFRGAALIVAVIAGLVSVSAGLRLGLLLSVLIALAYFAIADWLYIARLAAFVKLAEPEVSPNPLPDFSGPELLPPVTPPETETETETRF